MRGRRGVVAGLVLAVGVGVAGLVGVVAGAAGSSDGSALKAWGFPSGLVGGGVVPHITNARQLVLLGRNFTATVTIREFIGLVILYTVFWPLGLYLVFRYRVIQQVIAGYRERPSPSR
jgi:hypothetical protein